MQRRFSIVKMQLRCGHSEIAIAFPKPSDIFSCSDVLVFDGRFPAFCCMGCNNLIRGSGKISGNVISHKSSGVFIFSELFSSRK